MSTSVRCWSHLEGKRCLKIDGHGGSHWDGTDSFWSDGIPKEPSAITAFASAYGGFAALHAKLETHLGLEGERLWKDLVSSAWRVSSANEMAAIAQALVDYAALPAQLPTCGALYKLPGGGTLVCDMKPQHVGHHECRINNKGDRMGWPHDAELFPVSAATQAAVPIPVSAEPSKPEPPRAIDLNGVI